MLQDIWLPAVGAVAAAVCGAILLRQRRTRAAWALSLVSSFLLAVLLCRSLNHRLFGANDFWVGPLTAPGVLFGNVVISGVFFLWSIAAFWCLSKAVTPSLESWSQFVPGTCLVLLVAFPLVPLAKGARLMAIQAGVVGEKGLHEYLERAIENRDPPMIKAIAKSSNSGSELLGTIDELQWPELRKRRAGWSDLLLGDFRSVDMIVAEKASGDQELLATLATSSEKAVLYQVALGPAAVPEVQLQVVANPATPDGLLCRLILQGSEAVRKAAWDALARRGWPARLAFSRDPVVRQVFASSPGVSARLLRVLVRDPVAEVRCAVARNPTVEADLLNALAGDSDEAVRKCSSAALESRSKL